MAKHPVPKGANGDVRFDSVTPEPCQRPLGRLLRPRDLDRCRVEPLDRRLQLDVEALVGRFEQAGADREQRVAAGYGPGRLDVNRDQDLIHRRCSDPVVGACGDRNVPSSAAHGPRGQPIARGRPLARVCPAVSWQLGPLPLAERWSFPTGTRSPLRCQTR